MYDWAEFRHFRYLLGILEKGGYRIPADELHTSLPNLTVQSRQFQDNASVRLFRKSKSGRIYPTSPGQAFLALAPLLLEVCDEIIGTLIAIERGSSTQCDSDQRHSSIWRCFVSSVGCIRGSCRNALYGQLMAILPH